jgi:drug/metabolite transporter (DMT)-like permease
MINTKLIVLGFLLVATAIEVTGDAVVRIGMTQPALATKALYFVGGGLLLFGYGYALNSAPIAFEKVVGIYIATLFVMWQVIGYLFFRHAPGLPVLAGGSLIVVGGLIVAFWQAEA